MQNNKSSLHGLIYDFSCFARQLSSKYERRVQATLSQKAPECTSEHLKFQKIFWGGMPLHPPRVWWAYAHQVPGYATVSEKLEVLSELVKPINVTNLTFIMKHRPVAPGWRVSRSSVAICIIMYHSRPLLIYSTQMDSC